MRLGDRLKRIEAKIKPPTESLRIFRVMFKPQGEPYTRIQHGGRVWNRLEAETDDEFRLRAEAEAVLEPGHTGFLFLVD